MKIINYPSDLDPNLIIKKKCMERDFTCPYCKTSNNKSKINKMALCENWKDAWLEEGVYSSDMPIQWSEEIWYGYPDHKIHLFSFEKRQKWAKFICYCTKCNLKWEGDPFIILSESFA